MLRVPGKTFQNISFTLTCHPLQTKLFCDFLFGTVSAITLDII